MGRYLAQDFGIANIALEGRTDFADRSSAQEHFALLETKAKLRLNQSGSEKLLQQFQINYPLNPQVDRVNFDLANYYFDQQKYSYALKWYGKVKAADVPKRDIPKYNFNKGYTYFATKKYKAANFKRFLLTIQDKDMEAQHQLISKEFDRWKGDLEQIDDVCVMGVRV